MDILLKIKAFVAENDKNKPFPIVVTKAKKSQDADDYFCSIHLPGLFKDDKLIYGIDPEQAEQLSITFLRNVLADKKLTDKEGKPVIF